MGMAQDNLQALSQLFRANDSSVFLRRIVPWTKLSGERERVGNKTG
jgi:hypothetical protein